MEQYLISVDLGGSKVTAALGMLSMEGETVVVDAVTRPMEGFTRGEVTNIELVTTAIGEAVSQLEVRNEVKASEVWISISGKHVVKATNSGFVYVGGADGEVTTRDVDKLHDNMANVQAPDGKVIIARIPQSYKVDSNETIGSPVGYLIHGSYRQEHNLQTILEGRSQVGGNFLAGIATDEQDTNAAIDRLANTLDYALEHKLMQPQNFYGVGGMKIFRDLIYMMRGFMRADHKFFKSHGQYDFPQKQRGTVLKMKLVGALMSSEKLKAKMGNKMNEGMLMPYEKLLSSLDKK